MNSPIQHFSWHLLGLVTALLIQPANLAIAAIETVFEDASVISSAPNTNYNDGLLYVGHLTTPESGRSYLKFQLPSYVPGTQIVSATLRGLYNFAHASNNDSGPFSWYLAATDSWTETGVTWNNQAGTTGSAIASWIPSVGGITPWLYSWDITSAVNQEYQGGDGFISLVFQVDNESTLNNWQYWHSKEHPNGGDFEIEFEVEALSGVVPEAGSFLIWGGIAMTTYFSKTSRRRRNKA